jgi:predicted amidophosphoribosyltransferase
MVGLYCRGHHGRTKEICGDCRDLLEYALRRLDCCPFGAEKTTCAHCPIHCYKPEMRARVRAVMRYAGPRMLFRHPILALFHFLDGFGRHQAKRKS